MDIVYTKDKEYLLPENHITQPMPMYEYRALRGYAYILGVFVGEHCLGWILAGTLGYANAKEWLDATEGAPTLPYP